MKTYPLLTALPVCLLLAFAPSFRSSAPVTQKVADGVSNHFRADVAPVKAAQISTLSVAGFDAWLKQTSLTAAQQTLIRRSLQPVLKTGKFEALLVKKASLRNSKQVTDLVVVRVPKAVQQALNNSRFVSILASGPNDTPSAPVIETCQYNYCYCSGSANGQCVSATRFSKNCPPSECPVPQMACECEGGGPLSLEQAFETVYG
jgi:hypothetical protein